MLPLSARATNPAAASSRAMLKIRAVRSWTTGAGQVIGLAQVRHQGRPVRAYGARRDCGASSGQAAPADGPGGGSGRASRHRVLPTAEGCGSLTGSVPAAVPGWRCFPFGGWPVPGSGRVCSSGRRFWPVTWGSDAGQRAGSLVAAWALVSASCVAIPG